MKIKLFLFSALTLLMSGNNLQAQTIAQGDKMLVVYYSRTGNTKEIAEQIAARTGADIFEIKTVNAYPDDYRQTTDQAKKEIAEGYRPALKRMPENLEQYKAVFVGSPCWWGTVASPVATFLSEAELSGKTVIPFMTHGGSGLGRSVSDIKSMLPNSTVVEGKAFWGNSVKTANDDVADWLKGLQND